MTSILLTNPYGPYERVWGTNAYDIMETRFHRDQGPFSLKSTSHCAALYFIAENLNAETTVMEYPHIEDYEEELKKGYDYLGIQVIGITVNKVAHMMRVARKIAPQTKIVIGGYGVLNLYDPPPGETSGDAEYILENADHICREEGVEFMRKILGDEPIDRPIQQLYIPRNAAYFPGLEGMVASDNGMALVALGCPNGCEFCNTSAFFKKQKIYVSTPEQTFETMKHYCRRNGGQPAVTMLLDEDLLLNRDYVLELGRLIQEDTEFGLRKLSYFCFGDLRSMTQYSMEELLECGVDTIWIGVESSLDEVITSDHNIAKRSCDDIKSTFRGMEEYGLGITASMVLGWDFHTLDNIEKDVDFFVSLGPSAFQITYLGACPGTELYDRMKKEGRINKDFRFRDMQQCNDRNSFLPKHLGLDDLKHYFDLTHKKVYETNGPGIFRHFQLNLNGYETCSKSSRPLLREQKAELFEERCRQSYPMLDACEKFAPTEIVREKVRETKEKYRELFGEPTDEQKMFAGGFCNVVEQRIEQLKEPPTDEPFDPDVRRTYYNPQAREIPLVKIGRGPDEPAPYKVFDEPEPAASASC